jgi:hypothetical protein
LGKRGVARGSIPQALSPALSQRGREDSAVLADRFDRTTSQGFFASRELCFIFRLLADVGVCVLERSEEVVGSGIAADVAIDAGGIDVEGAVSVFLNFVVSVRHESADYADFTD